MMGVDTGAEQTGEHLHANKLINLYIFGRDSSIYKYDAWHVWFYSPSLSLSVSVSVLQSFLLLRKKILIRPVSFKIIMCNYSWRAREREGRERSWGKLAFIIVNAWCQGRNYYGVENTQYKA
jgi:hypothetical protein